VKLLKFTDLLLNLADYHTTNWRNLSTGKIEKRAFHFWGRLFISLTDRVRAVG
jgi:hypothetical protein